MAEISQEELAERVAIIKRFKALLVEQRGKFQEYLTVLEKQQDSITAENPDKLLAHTELEQQIVRNLSSLQKVIVPMKKLYSTNSSADAAQEEAEIKKIQDDLSDLQMKVLKQNEINRDLLKVHIGKLRTQMDNFKNPYKNNRSVYASAQNQRVATLVQVDA
jgi:hypothetical protein